MNRAEKEIAQAERDCAGRPAAELVGYLEQRVTVLACELENATAPADAVQVIVYGKRWNVRFERDLWGDLIDGGVFCGGFDISEHITDSDLSAIYDAARPLWLSKERADADEDRVTDYMARRAA